MPKESWSYSRDTDAGLLRYPYKVASTDYHQRQATPDLQRVPANTVGRSVPRLGATVIHSQFYTTMRWLRKGNLKKEIESQTIAAQNNTLRTKYIKAKLIICRRIASVGYVVIDKTVNHVNVAKQHKSSTRLGMTA